MADQPLHDIIISGGTVVDGTGAARFDADVAIDNGRITAVGEPGSLGAAGQTIDATGMIVAPGFVDPHTHYDAQLFWDPLASPSTAHGVTTAVMGNCGFTLAPIADDDGADYLRRMMVKVEGMPLDALEQGVPWNWSSFADYLDRLEGRVGLNVAVMVGHCAIRRAVMGADATAGPATAEQVEAMQGLLSDAIDAGGLGLSTTRSSTHSDGDGVPVPSRHADDDELLALCDVVGQYDGTTLEWASNGCLSGFSDDEVTLMTDMTKRANRPLNWNVLTVDSARPDDYRNQVEALDEVARRGGRSVALTMPVLVGMNMSFGTFCGLNLMPDWGDILGLPVPERIERLKDPETRRFMEERASSPDAGVFSRLAGWDRYVIGDTFSPENDGLTGRKIGDIARERGVRDFHALLDIVIADDLRTVLWPGPTDDDPASWAMRQTVWDHPNVIIGGSDAGAHLDRISGAPYTSQWLQDSLHGKQLASLEATVEHLTSVPAQLFGLRDRGTLAVGNHADVIVFDPESVGAGPTAMVHDLPGGAGRLVADAIGMHWVLVNGVPLIAEGTPTPELPGRVLRSGTDTETVALV